MSGDWVPAFPGQRPPFAKGNRLSVGNFGNLRHGAYSPRRVNPIALTFIEEVLTDPATAYLAAPRYQAALWGWAVAAARVQLIGDWVDGMDIRQAADSKRGQVSPLELLRRWMATLQTAAARIGLDPLSAARLGKDIAQGRHANADAALMLTRLRAEHDIGTSQDGEE